MRTLKRSDWLTLALIGVGFYLSLCLLGCGQSPATIVSAPVLQAEFSTPWSALSFAHDSVFQGDTTIYVVLGGRLTEWPSYCKLALPVAAVTRDTVWAILGDHVDTLKIVMDPSSFNSMPAGW